MKKVFISFILALISITSFAQTLDKGTASALAFINQGYVKYGFEELNRIARTNGLAAPILCGCMLRKRYWNGKRRC